MRAKKTSLDAGGKSIAILNGKDSLELGLHPLDKVVIKKGPRKITATIDTSKNLVKKGNIVVYEEISRILKLKNNDAVNVEPCARLHLALVAADFNNGVHGSSFLLEALLRSSGIHVAEAAPACRLA